MTDQVKTTTETTTSTEQTPSDNPSKDKTPVGLQALLTLGDKYGVGTVVMFLLFYLFVIPMRDGHLHFLEVTGKAVTDQVDTSKQISKSNESIAIGVDKMGEVIDTLKIQSVENSASNRAVLDRSAEHYMLSKETHEDVKAIKEVIVKPPKTTRPQ